MFTACFQALSVWSHDLHESERLYLVEVSIGREFLPNPGQSPARLEPSHLPIPILGDICLSPVGACRRGCRLIKPYQCGDCKGVVMPTVQCKTCKVAVANRPGPLCYRCWKAAGGVESERGESEEVPRDLRDMRWVYRHPDSKTTSSARQELQKLYKGSPEKFLARKDRLEALHLGQATGVEAQVWDGVSVCPTCARGPIGATKDIGLEAAKKEAQDWLDKHGRR